MATTTLEDRQQILDETSRMFTDKAVDLVNRPYDRDDATTLVLLALSVNVERIARSLERLANAIDSEVGLSVTARIEES